MSREGSLLFLLGLGLVEVLGEERIAKELGLWRKGISSLQFHRVRYYQRTKQISLFHGYALFSQFFLC